MVRRGETLAPPSGVFGVSSYCIRYRGVLAPAAPVTYNLDRGY